jgi:hypothetical protein
MCIVWFTNEEKCSNCTVFEALLMKNKKMFEKSLFEIGFFMSVNKRGTSNLKTPPEVHNNVWD